MEKATKINLKIKSKPCALLQTQEKTCEKFHKDQFKTVWEVVITKYPLSKHLRSENDKVQKVEKKLQTLRQALYEKHMYIFRLWRKHVQTFKKIGTKLYEETSCAHKVPTVNILRVKMT